MTVELKDSEVARVASYCQGSARPPELGALARFLRTAAHSRKCAETSVLMGAVRAATAAWPSADWRRNPAAHAAFFGEEDFSRCSDLVHGQEGLLWRLIIATSRRGRVPWGTT